MVAAFVCSHSSMWFCICRLSGFGGLFSLMLVLCSWGLPYLWCACCLKQANICETVLVYPSRCCAHWQYASRARPSINCSLTASDSLGPTHCSRSRLHPSVFTMLGPYTLPRKQAATKSSPVGVILPVHILWQNWLRLPVVALALHPVEVTLTNKHWPQNSWGKC